MMDLEKYLQKCIKTDSNSCSNLHIFNAHRAYTFLGKYQFQVYGLNDFKLDEVFNNFHKAGLYCFTTEGCFVDVSLRNEAYFKTGRVHNLFYIGKTDDFSKRNFDNHQHLTNFKAIDLDINKKFVGIYVCAEDENPKDIESEILSAYNFEDNVSENSDNANYPKYIQEF